MGSPARFGDSHSRSGCPSGMNDSSCPPNTLMTAVALGVRICQASSPWYRPVLMSGFDCML